jgi:hypothetical protein
MKLSAKFFLLLGGHEKPVSVLQVYGGKIQRNPVPVLFFTLLTNLA